MSAGQFGRAVSADGNESRLNDRDTLPGGWYVDDLIAAEVERVAANARLLEGQMHVVRVLG